VTCPSTDPFGYMQKEQDLTLNEDFGTIKVPFGSVGFKSFDPNPWNTSILPREYNVDTVVGVDENQRQTFYNKFSVNVGGKDYDIPIKTATTKQVVPAAKFSWWNPRLMLGVDSGINIEHVKGEITPSLSLSAMSWGIYKTTPTLSVLQVGIGYAAINKTAEIVITPVAFNFGNQFFSPFMNNTYVAPSLGINTDGSFTANVGLRVGF
jgi:hypothetical protein